jgi:hypothetical protein
MASAIPSLLVAYEGDTGLMGFTSTSQGFDLQAELFKMQCEGGASNYELDLLIESGELYNLAKELYLLPSKYADVIRTLRQRCGSQATLVDTNKVNIFNPPSPPGHSPTTLLCLPSPSSYFICGSKSSFCRYSIRLRDD